jgi:hypothetical protein
LLPVFPNFSQFQVFLEGALSSLLIWITQLSWDSGLWCHFSLKPLSLGEEKWGALCKAPVQWGHLCNVLFNSAVSDCGQSIQSHFPMTSLIFYSFQWSNIFPTEQVTETQSCLFVKKLLAVAVSNITYLRAIFPEHAFGDRCLEGEYHLPAICAWFYFSWISGAELAICYWILEWIIFYCTQDHQTCQTTCNS